MNPKSKTVFGLPLHGPLVLNTLKLLYMGKQVKWFLISKRSLIYNLLFLVHYDILQTILFTMDEEILEAMAQYDQTYDGNEEDEDELLRSCYFERPTTADQAEEGVSLQLYTDLVNTNDLYSTDVIISNL